MPRSRACARCRHTASPGGAPTIVVAVRNGCDVYACAEHQKELAGPPGDTLVALAQYQDMARRRAGR
ncbi:hypothetical protein [Streptomyces showdoensis]|uniref:hypothetical protein n=1 Tax=Streptomyces showdoensis TaxID=68268 RepID=UPI00103CFA74|nr:hypothetical protein [Streptomyces showdoensis]